MKAPWSVGNVIEWKGEPCRIEQIKSSGEVALCILAQGTMQKVKVGEGTEPPEIAPEDRHLEFLYTENGRACFLDLASLDILSLPLGLVTDQVNYLRAGIQVTARCYKQAIASIELPHFLEIMVTEMDEEGTGSHRHVVLKSGITIEVPNFIEVGDIIKVDTRHNEFIQRV